VFRVAICVPFIDTGCEWRRRAKDFTAAHWDLLGVLVVYGTSDAQPINRSAARNDAARQTDADVIVFCDADTWIDIEAFWQMVERAGETDRLVHGYTKHMHLSRKATEATLDGRTVKSGQVILNQPLGIVAVSRSLLDLVGGFDERFIGWGGEDRAFQFACDTLAGPGERIDAMSYHLWHPNAPEKGRGTATRKRNIALAVRYKEAAGQIRSVGPLPRTRSKVPDPEAMRRLLSEPGGPLRMSPIRVTN
jgi:glycosyltransferase involved in cell wall biosynthesis